MKREIKRDFVIDRSKFTLFDFVALTGYIFYFSGLAVIALAWLVYLIKYI